MNPKRILLFTVIIMAVLSFSCLILPDTVASIYVTVMHPLALFLGFVFALRVASTYRKQLKKSFLFLALFLLFYIPTNIPSLWKYLASLMGTNTIYLVLLLQIIDYAMLIISCVYTLSVIDVKRMNRYGWISLGLMIPLCVFVVVYEIPWMMEYISLNPIATISMMVIRVFDMTIILMLMPVLFLYLQYLRQKHQESVTFSLTMGALIIILLSTYVFQLRTGLSLYTISREYFQKGSLLDAIYMLGYLLMATGLFVHLKYDEWGYKTIDKFMTGEPPL